MLSPPPKSLSLARPFWLRAVKLRLTLFIAAKPWIWRVFSRFRTRPSAPFSNASLEPARQLTEPLDQGLAAIHVRHPGLDIPQPRQIRLAGLLAQGQFSVLQFPK